MNCELNRTLLSAYVDGALSEEERADVELHLNGCTHCRDWVEDIQALGQSVRHTMSLQMAPSGVERKVLEAVGALRRRTQLRRAMSVCALCAVVGFFMSLIFLFSPFGVLVRPLFHLFVAASREGVHLSSFVSAVWAWMVCIGCAFVSVISLFGIRRLVRTKGNEVAA